MEQTYTTAAPVNATNPPFSVACKRCASPNLFIKEQGPHLGLFCRDCDLWQRWIRKSDARRYQREKVRRAEPKLTYPEVSEHIGFTAVVNASNTDLAARVEKLERAFAGYDRQLTILTRTVLACGVLQGRGAPDVDVDDRRIAQLGRELAEEEGR